MAQTLDSQPRLKDGVPVDDMVGYDEMQCYKYYVKSKEATLQV